MWFWSVCVCDRSRLWWRTALYSPSWPTAPSTHSSTWCSSYSTGFSWAIPWCHSASSPTTSGSRSAWAPLARHPCDVNTLHSFRIHWIHIDGWDWTWYRCYISPVSFLQVYSSIYFCGHLFFFTAFMVLPYLRKALVPKREKKQD